MKKETIGLIGGGQMGEALVRGMINSGLVPAGRIMVAEPDGKRRDSLSQTYQVKVTDIAEPLCDFASVLILAVKPQIIRPVLAQYKVFVGSNHLLISIAAGVPISAIEREIGRQRIIRVMPNTPALVLAGASALSPNEQASAEDLQLGMKIFSAIGTCVHLPESLLDAVTGLSGSGPGYVFTFIEAMIDGGVLAGIPRPVAEQLVLQTVYGSAKLALETGKPPAVLKGMVTSPGGTTIAGLHVLEEAGMRGAIMTAVDRAGKRSKELGS
ncbi:MAG TPA: pyrroline-5-carboxylate reductase [Desulfobulbaceae bacterium]|nr:pyrroline-5-carboxylate reductase [Desulfobulbaceae bacterium]